MSVVLCSFYTTAMKLLKPAWISREGGKPIFSVAIHPDGSRFATGGQGQGNDWGVVSIWNMAPVRSAQSELNDGVPKVLCKMTNHLGCVNCVRWSRDGKWLASGGDDGIVMIWEIKYQGVGESLGGSTTHEQWGCLHMLRGHGGDVLDVSWSPDLKYLASCSVDNTIVIWNARSLPQKFTVLEGHDGLVKGLTWDPVGKYLASQSDDRSVRIWRTSDWKEEKKVTEPFKQCGGTTHVLRLSWSPDGRYLISAHALNNDGPTAQIIERGGGWRTAMDFVGHRKAVEVVSFNPQLFVQHGHEENHGCVAIGSRDRTLSVWLTNLKRPLVVTHDLFQDSILDISWSMDGYELLVCSTDGTIAYISFTEKELGVTLSEQALGDLFQSIYGCKPISTAETIVASSDILIEDPEVLVMQRAAKTDQRSQSPSLLALNHSRVSDNVTSESPNLSSTSASLPTVQHQSESRTKDGRRRITPVMISSQPSSLSGAPLPFTSFSPKKDGTEHQKVCSVGVPRLPGKLHTSNSSELLMPKVSISCAGILSPPPKPTSFAPLSPTKVREIKPFSSDSQESEAKKAIATLDKPTKACLKRGLEPSLAVILPKAKKSKRSSVIRVVESPSKPHKSSVGHSLPVRQQILSIPEVQTNITRQIASGSDEIAPCYLEISNSIHQSTISARKGNDLVWSASLPKDGLLLDGNQSIACVVMKDYSLVIYSSQTGRLLMPRISLFSPSHLVQTQAQFVLVVSCDAHLSVWDTRCMKSVITQVSFSHLIQSDRHPRSFHLTCSGIPVVAFDSVSYIFHHDMGVWVEIFNASEISEIEKPPFASATAESAPLHYIQTSSLCVSDTMNQRLARMKDTQSSHFFTLTFLETQISRAQCMKSPREFQYWCKQYVQFLVAAEMEVRLREFCSRFTTPSGYQELLFGLERSALLKDFLLLIAGNAKLQRLYCEVRDSAEGCQTLC